jgi:Putative prokaryotic signal transducing protein
MDTDSANRGEQRHGDRYAKPHSGSLVKVGSYGSRQEAEIARGMLEENGIPAFVQGGEMATTMFFAGTALGGVVLQAPESRAEEARRILADEFGNTDSIPAWRCSNCGADVDAGFDVCWQCGESFADAIPPVQSTPTLDPQISTAASEPATTASPLADGYAGDRAAADSESEIPGDDLVVRALRSAVFGVFLFPICFFSPIAFTYNYGYWILALYLLLSFPFSMYALNLLGDARNAMRGACSARRLILAHIVAYTSIVIFPTLVLYVLYWFLHFRG